MSSTVEVRKPRVLVVDDEVRNLRIRKKQLEGQNLDVAVADSETAALNQIEASPEMDAVLTDISFTQDPRDTSGVKLARTIKARFGDIPLFAYSAKVEERLLREEAQSLFTLSIPKGIKFEDELRELADTIRDTSLQRRHRRRTEFDQQLAELVVRHPLETINAAETVRRLLPHARDAADIETSLKAAGYHLELIHSSVFQPSANPVLIWVKELGDEIEAEVYGQPSLYAHGESGDDVVAKLIELMRLFAEDFRNDDGDYGGPALRLRDFLERTILLASNN
ncbi:MAG TPA: response regulator [Solirubrobacterales bacterium]